MPYQRLAARLADGPSPHVSTLPDGSIDRYCWLSAGALDSIDRRITLARELEAGGRKGFGVEPVHVEPGGQSVNTAAQVHALGADATCYGHLDNSIFDSLPFDTASMGEPAVVNVLEFEDDDLLLVEHSPDIQNWTLADLRDAAPLDSVFDADAVTCSNWVSIPAMGEAFRELADEALPRVPFVFDPGDVLGNDLSGHGDLRAAVAALQSTLKVVVSVNRTELRALAAALPDPPDPPAGDRDRVRALREAFDGAAVVKHGKEEALAATGEGVVAVDNPTVEADGQTGGGDRFAGGLAVGLGAGWDWDVALACGNACASYYVATGETATAEELQAWVA